MKYEVGCTSCPPSLSPVLSGDCTGNEINVTSLMLQSVDWSPTPVVFTYETVPLSFTCTNPALSFVDIFLDQNGGPSLLVCSWGMVSPLVAPLVVRGAL